VPIIEHYCYAVVHKSMQNSKSDKIRDALKAVVGDGQEDLISSILETLDKQKLFRYHNENTISLLSTPGRVLVALIEDNSITQRALSNYLNISETMIDKTIKSLIDKGLVTKTKVNRKNVYRISVENVISHPDIQHLLGAINTMKQEEEVGDGDLF
jgi:predicted HTH transcriptional regulator